MEKKKILLVDDEIQFCVLVKRNLEKTKKFEVAFATNGVAALASAERNVPDLLLIDMVMPGMMGSELLAEIQKRKTLKDIPVIFLTALVLDQETKKSEGLVGGFLFLAKPISDQKLVTAIEKQLKID